MQDIDQFTKEIGARIKECRLSMGLSQEAIATDFGYTQSKWSRIENGIGVGDLYLLYDLCELPKAKALGLPASQSGL